MLTISVKNFGPIAEGSVDLKPLTIFVGPSNTGKSYMATAVHAVMREFAGYKYPFRLKYDEYDDYRAMYHSVVELLSSQCESELARKELAISTLPAWIRSQIQESNQKLLNNVQRNVIRGLNRAFGVLDGAVDHLGFQVVVHRDNPPLDLLLAPQNDALSLPQFSLSKASISLAEFDLSPPLPGLYDDDGLYSEIIDSLDNGIAKLILSEFPSDSIYLPAARSGMVQSHKALAGGIIRQASQAGIHPLTVPTLPDTVAEFLSHLVTLDPRRKIEGYQGIDNVVLFLETSVLQGLVDMDESEGLPYPEIAYQTTAGKFLLHQASSMVSELAPVVLFLKYLIGPGDLLIFEEPESHLHPAAQRQLARGIVRLVNAGVRVLITTHSDIIISQINNLLALRQASPELIDSSGFEPEDFLQPDQLSAYLFRYSHELTGCETVPLEIDSDTGIDEDEFASVFEAIYDESIALQRNRN
jgi:predicted ATPase